ncbi:hypothetical protein M9H77_19589 [Catharanthus roseus]|uniref:Uncharacterized protein n=1 Tax=Catharanthus roseus TaxID=4058 RepID=A0ACC0BAQ9_CATRO|nr:hypothetical protein M9H77_19589 [Catharanthus roseus]
MLVTNPDPTLGLEISEKTRDVDVYTDIVVKDVEVGDIGELVFQPIGCYQSGQKLSLHPEKAGLIRSGQVIVGDIQWEDEVQRDIQQARRMRDRQEGEPTPGETALEGFFVRSGLSLTPMLRIRHQSLQNVTPMGMRSPFASMDMQSDTPMRGWKRHNTRD